MKHVIYYQLISAQTCVKFEAHKIYKGQSLSSCIINDVVILLFLFLLHIIYVMIYDVKLMFWSHYNPWYFDIYPCDLIIYCICFYGNPGIQRAFYRQPHQGGLSNYELWAPNSLIYRQCRARSYIFWPVDSCHWPKEHHWFWWDSV